MSDDVVASHRSGSIAGVVLAAGFGSRFEGESHKLLAPFRGKPLVVWALEAALGAGFSDVLSCSDAVASAWQRSQVPGPSSMDGAM